MTDKEFKRLSRSQLIDIIYQLQLKQEELTADNERLSKALEDKRLLVSEAGNIAEAALEVHNVMQAAQAAAAHYIEEIQVRADQEFQRILSEANDNAAAIVEKARQEAAAIVENAQQEATAIIEEAQQEAAEIVVQAENENPDYDLVVEAILREYKDDPDSTGDNA